MDGRNFEHGASAMTPRDASGLQFAQRTLSRWASFPVANPRPIVLVDGPVLVTAGFNTSDAKDALHYGLVSTNLFVADEPLRTIRANGAHRAGQRRPSHDLNVVSATLSRTSFATDRGPTVLSAWELVAVDALGPIWVLADSTLERCWAPPVVPEGDQQGWHLLNSATVGPDDRDLAVVFTGSPPGFVDYEAAVLESDSAVTVLPLPRPIVEFPDGTAFAPVGMLRQVSATLSRPLGNRVLINNDMGAPCRCYKELSEGCTETNTRADSFMQKGYPSDRSSWRCISMTGAKLSMSRPRNRRCPTLPTPDHVCCPFFVGANGKEGG